MEQLNAKPKGYSYKTITTHTHTHISLNVMFFKLKFANIHNLKFIFNLLKLYIFYFGRTVLRVTLVLNVSHVLIKLHGIRQTAEGSMLQTYLDGTNVK